MFGRYKNFARLRMASYENVWMVVYRFDATVNAGLRKTLKVNTRSIRRSHQRNPIGSDSRKTFLRPLQYPPRSTDSFARFLARRTANAWATSRRSINKACHHIRPVICTTSQKKELESSANGLNGIRFPAPFKNDGENSSSCISLNLFHSCGSIVHNMYRDPTTYKPPHYCL